VRGRLTAVTHRYRGLGFRGLNLELTDVDLDVARPYLDTLPFIGRLSGRLRADGYFDQMEVGVDWQFYDYRVDGHPPNLVQMRGPVTMGGPEGFIFHNVTVDSADLDLPTVRLAVPAAILEGRARGSGFARRSLEGRHLHRPPGQHDQNRPPSVMDGRIRINTRDSIVALDADLNFLPLNFEGVRRSFPTLTSTGDLRGPVHLEGPLDHMFVRADVTGGWDR
jgi:hypothetical protein